MAGMMELAGSLHQGRLPGGGAVRHIVHVGIGGSLLGTRLVCEALEPADAPLTVHFLGSVDAHVRERLLARLDPAQTLVVLVSKSFTTGDTLMHGRRLAAWLQQALGEQQAQNRLVAVTSQPERTASLPVTPAHVLYFPEWVGGRYSLWSPVSLSAAALIGPQKFQQMLAGGAEMDAHFQHAPLDRNLPVLLGVLGVWNRNFQQHAAWGVMPYDQRLRLLPAHLQQVIMESTGKSVNHAGQRVDLETAPVVFGETGTEAQHSVFQAMHQGSDIVPLNFVAVVRPEHADIAAHDELLANLLAQLTALAQGRGAEETRADLGIDDDRLVAHRSFAGNRPSELLLLDSLTPRTLGMLLALYEHKVFVESVIWDVNAFDQWGVELGKTLAPGILNALEGGANTEPSLHGLLDHIHSRR
jgi:glucose-6-phosphate isomerase